MALRLWRGSALRCSRSAPHRLRPALGADCAGTALPRARVPVARCWARRNRCHVAPACGRTAHAPGTVRGLRPRRVHHGLGAPPSPAARNIRISPRHAVGDSGKAERDGLTSRSRRHDSAHPPACTRVVRGLLRLVGHPRLDHMGHRCSRTGASPRSAPATPTPGRRRRNDGGRSDPRGCSASSVNSGVGGHGRLAPRRPGHGPRARSPVRHGARGDARGQARARRLVAAGRRLGWSRARTRPRIRGHERVGRHRHGGRGGLRSLLGDCCRAGYPHRGRRDAAASLIGKPHG